MRTWTTRQLIVLFAATLVPRAVLAALLGNTGYPEWWEYDVIGHNLVEGAGHVYFRMGFAYAAYSPPLWSFILAGLRLLPGQDHLAIQVAQAAFCLAAALIFGAIAKRISGDSTVAFVTALFVVLQPSLLYYSVSKSDPLPLNCMLLGGITLLGLDLLERPAAPTAAAFGLMLALGVLSRGTPIVALPVIALALLLASGLRIAAIQTSIAMLFLFLGLSPWLVRNQAVLGRPLITTTAGENFWRGNHEGATGGVLNVNGGRITWLHPDNPDLPDTVRGVLRGGDELDREDVFMSEGLAFVNDHPGAAVTLFIRKMRTFWWRIESDAGDYPPLAAIAYEIVYRSELVLAGLGAVVVWRRRADHADPRSRRELVVVLMIMLGISALQSAFYVQGRHRFLIEPMLLIFTATGATWLGTRLRGQRGSEAAAGVFGRRATTA